MTTDDQMPSHLDEEGVSLWIQCQWIIEGGAASPGVSLQLQALAIRRELRLESAQKQLLAVIVSRLRDIARRIVPGRNYSEVREELEAMANQYEAWWKS